MGHLIIEEQTMNFLTIYGKRTVALAGSMLLCGTMGFGQMHGSAPSTGQAPGQGASTDAQMSNMQTSGQPSPVDRMFVSKAMQGSMAEVQLGQLTLQKSSNPQVKEFAQRMIDDHSKLNDQMKPVAQQLGVTVPNEVSKGDRKIIAKLQALSGPAYDQAYIKDMVKDHKQDLNEFQMEASSGQDQTVRDAANQGSKVIAQHLQMAQQLAKDQNVPATGQ
jgi:putative membrane protein